MNYTFYETAMLFFAWSFLAWLAETSYATIKEKNFRNRGFAFGPFCFIYGFTGALFAVFFQELRSDTFFLFLGCAAVATGIQWLTGKTLERINQKKWWNYSDKKWNFDGYICLSYSLLWGLLGLLSVRYLNDFLLSLYHLLPNLCLYAGMTVLQIFPELLNGWGSEPLQGKVRTYGVRMVRNCKMFVILGMLFPSAADALGIEMDAAYSLLVMAGILGTIAYYLIRIYQYNASKKD